MFKWIYNIFHNHYHRRYFGIYDHAKQLFVFDMFLLSFAVLLLGASVFFFTWKPGVARDVEVSLSLGNERIKSGSQVHLTIDYTNNSKVALENATLSFRLPRGFIIDKNRSDELDETSNSLAIGKLPPGSSGQKNLYGTLWTNIGETEKIIATLAFKQEGTNNFEKSYGVMLLSLPESLLTLNLETSESAFTGQKMPFTAELKNSSPERLKDIGIFLNGKQFDKQFDLLPGASATYTDFIIPIGRGEKYSFTVDARIKVGNNQFSQSNVKRSIDLVSPRISLSARIPDAPAYTDPGSSVPIEIMWRNQGSGNLKDQNIVIQTTPGVIDLAATAKENRLERDGSNLIVTPKTRTALADGKPGSGENFKLTLILLPDFEKKAVGVNTLTIKPIFRAGSEKIDEQVFESTGESVSIKLPAEVFLRTEARYYSNEGDQLGRGPVPPQVGKTTKYWIFGTLFDKVNGLSSNRLVFTMAPGVTFTGKQSVSIGPELIYDQNARTMTWNYGGVIPADSESGFYFEVAVTPKSEQAGYILNLLSGAEYTGTDDETGKQFDIKLKNTSNLLPASDKGSKKGALVTP